MLEIQDILEVEKYIDDVDAVVFDLDDTLYSEKEYWRENRKPCRFIVFKNPIYLCILECLKCLPA